MRVGALAALLLLAAGCGGEASGFRIDFVSVSPDDFPLFSGSSEDIAIKADVFNDRHEVLEVLVTSDQAPIWIELEPGRYPRWSIDVPIVDFQGYAIGTYWLDFEARDAADRDVSLKNAVRIKITED